MSKNSSNNTESTVQRNVVTNIVNLRVTYKKASIPELENLTFSNLEVAMDELSTLQYVQECLILQTCNRIEIFAVFSSKESALEQSIAEFWRKKCNLDASRFYCMLETDFGDAALMHILRLTSGLESMIIGEDQILGQTREALQSAKNRGKSGPVLQRVFESALRTGILVRRKTQIHKGAVSIGSIAANFLEEHLGNLKDKSILVIGAGQIGTLVGKALATRKTGNIFVTNRTNERAMWLAKILNAQAVTFNKITEPLAFVDATIVATASSNYVLNQEMISKVMQQRNSGKLLIIDLSQPRNVEEDIGNLPNVELKNIDSLRCVAAKNMQMRLEEAKKVEDMLNSELHRLINKLKQGQIEPLISILYSKAEKNRRIEVNKALKMMKNASECKGHFSDCDKCKQIVNDLSRELIEKTLMDPVKSLRKAAVTNNFNRILEAEALFNVKSGDQNDVSTS